MQDRPVIRWLLRVLGDDSFLPLYLGDRQRPPSTQETLRLGIERAFWGLTPDDEHPVKYRAEAWKEIEAILARDPLDVSTFYFGLIADLQPKLRGKNAEIARFWAWPELADASDSTGRASEGREWIYHEIHAHFRGSIPVDRLWLWLLQDWRVSEQLRKQICNVGSWERTRAELVEHAAEIRRKISASALPTSAEREEAELRARCCLTLRDLPAAQYMALYANFRRSLLHQRGSTGLVSFSKSFHQISTLAKRSSKGVALRKVDREAVVAVLKRFEQSGARSVELRPTLEETRSASLEKLKTIVLGYFDYLGAPDPNRIPVVMALVPSLFKQEKTLGCSDHGAAKDDGLHARLEDQQTTWRQQAETLLGLIDDVPLLRMFLVGIDVAGREMGSPVRALAPALALVHAYHQEWNLEHCVAKRNIPVSALARELAARRDPDTGEDASDATMSASDALWEALDVPDGPLDVERRRLGLTVHAGEDFMDPVTGLREIWEAVKHLGLRRHDRIGHAIALSLDESRLFQLLRRRGQSAELTWVHELDGSHWRLRKPLGVHALDTAWAASLGVSTASAELAHALSRAMGVVPLHQAVRSSMDSAAFPSSVMLPGVCFVDPDALEPEHWCWIEIDDAWRRRFEELRQRVIAVVRDTGIVIESCPTSNCAVANLNEPPLFGLLEISPPLRVGIATDDPGVLDAWPEHELERLKDPKHEARVLKENEAASFVRGR